MKIYIYLAFDLAVPLTENKEKSELKTDARFAYGTKGKLVIPVDIF